MATIKNFVDNTNISQEEEQIVQDLAKSWEQDKNFFIGNWTIKIYQWLNQARAYVEENQSVLNKLSNSLVINKKGKDEINLISLQDLKRTRIVKSKLIGKNILTSGYQLLNEIGETIRGEEILYSITFTKTGKNIADSGANEVYTWKIPMEEFINLLSFSPNRITLKESTTIYNMMSKNQNYKNSQLERWTEEKIQNYAIFSRQVRTNPKWKWNNINEGNMLESYLRFLRNGGDVNPHPIGGSNYYREVYISVYNTMKAPDPFYKGGDIDNEQIKSLNASVTSINSLILRLQEVFQMLTNSKPGYDIIKKYYKKNVSKSIDEMAKETSDQIVEELTKYFTSSIDRLNDNFIDIDF